MVGLGIILILMNTPTNQIQQEELLVEEMQNLLKTGDINV